ncbi:MAG: ABC transporter ATP-binding protein, partial [Cyanobacteria bacterium]|nr:ABC transporter ATP-binding protein [Cyanobacteria bacterium GSL.Bin21]
EAVFLAQRIYVLTARPGTIQKEIQINLPRNEYGSRSYHVKALSEFQNYREKITQLLRNHSVEQEVMVG